MPFRLLTRPPFTRYPLSVGKAASADAAYQAAVLGLSPIAYWPLTETSGTTADNAEGTAARDGTYSGVTLNSTAGPFGGPAGLWDGNDDYCDIHSASLNAALDWSAISISVWFKAFDATVWNGTTFKFIMRLRDDTPPEHHIVLYKNNAANQLVGGTNINTEIDNVVKSSFSSTAWNHLVATFSDANNRMRFYLNGSQEGTDQAVAASPSSPTLTSSACTLGASSTAPSLLIKGYIAHAAVFASELTAANVTTLYNGGPI